MGFVVREFTPSFRVTVRVPQSTVQAGAVPRIATYDSDASDTVSQAFKASIARISTSRRIGDAGSFSITLYPQKIIGPYSWERLITPMSYVEISFSRYDVQTTKTVVMRGFVDRVSHSFDIAGGTPLETITITGTDWTKIATIPFYYWVFDTSTNIQLFTVQLMLKWLGGMNSTANLNFKWLASTLLSFLFDNFLQPLIQQIQISLRVTSNHVPVLHVAEAEADPNEQAGVFATFHPIIESLGSAITPNTTTWELLQTYQGKPWRELYFDDFDQGPVLVYKPTPWRDVNGNYIQSNTWQGWPRGNPTIIHVTQADVTSFALERSDDQVYNAFLTYLQQSEPFTDLSKFTKGAIRLGSGQNPILLGGVDPAPLTPSDPRLFGLRWFEALTPFLDYSGREKNANAIQKQSEDITIGKNSIRMNNLVASAFGFNELLEHGIINTWGNVDAHVGIYLSFERYKTKPAILYYVEGVSHSFSQPGAGNDGYFFTSYQLTRGEVFRNDAGGST